MCIVGLIPDQIMFLFAKNSLYKNGSPLVHVYTGGPSQSTDLSTPEFLRCKLETY